MLMATLFTFFQKCSFSIHNWVVIDAQIYKYWSNITTSLNHIMNKLWGEICILKIAHTTVYLRPVIYGVFSYFRSMHFSGKKKFIIDLGEEKLVQVILICKFLTGNDILVNIWRNWVVGKERMGGKEVELIKLRKIMIPRQIRSSEWNMRVKTPQIFNKIRSKRHLKLLSQTGPWKSSIITQPIIRHS